MSYGIKVKLSNLDTIEQFCNNRTICYLIWNIEAILAESTDFAEIDFDTEKDQHTVHQFNYELERSSPD